MDPGPALGPRAERLCSALEWRLTARAVAAGMALAAAAVLLVIELLAAGLAFGGPALAGLAEGAGRWLPLAAAFAAAAALWPLVRRPGRIYLASLVEKACPQLAGQLLVLAEHEAGRTELPPGAAELMAERVDAALGAAPLEAGRAAAFERAGRAPFFLLTAATAVGLALVAAGGGQFLEALGELCGVSGAGPTRIAAVQPGNAALDEGQSLPVGCRVAGRAPRSVTLVAGALRTAMRRGDDGLWRAELEPRGSGRYAVEAEGRAGTLAAGPFDVQVRPRPLAWIEKVVYRYPEYTGLRPRESDSPEIDGLLGALAELRLRSRGAVGRVEVRAEPGGTLPAERDASGAWRCELRLRKVGGYSIWVVPESGGAAREVARGAITVRADLAPTAAALARRLPDGRVAVDYRVADDYRLGPAKMIFLTGGRKLAYEVPDVAGRREAQGAVLVPKEVLAAADGGFRYRLEACDTHQPEPNRSASADQDFRTEREVAMAGPVLEKRPLQMGGSHTQPQSPGGGGADSGTGTQTTRPLENLYKSGDEGEQPPAPPSGRRERPGAPDDPYMAPSGGGDAPEPPSAKPPGGDAGKPGDGQKPPDGDKGSGDNPGANPEQPTVNTPRPGGGNSGGDGHENTPGGSSSGSGGGDKPNPNGNGGANTRPADKPPTGSESGVGQARPEQVIPGKVDMDVKPGERPVAVGPAPGPLRTDWGGAHAFRPGSGSTSPTVRAPDGSLRTGAPPTAEPGQDVGAPPAAAPLPAPRYRRYVNQYLEALATERGGS